MRLILALLGAAWAVEEPFAALAPSRASLVYVAPAPVGSPGVFGHCLLVLHGARGDVAVGYAAEAAVDDGVPAMAWKGLCGGYTGAFQIDPAGPLLSTYGEAEARAAWSYDLELAPGELSRLLQRLDAGVPQRQPYRLLDRNCSTALIGLLDAARPGSVVPPAGFAEPADVVRAAQAAGMTGDGRRLPGPDAGLPPERQPGAVRVRWGGGVAGDARFAELGLRPAWHERDDVGTGLLGTGIGVLAVDLRWYEDHQGPVPARADLIAIDALAPPPGWRAGTAWRLALGAPAVRQGGDLDQQARLALGWGASWRPVPGGLGYALVAGDLRLIEDLSAPAAGAGGEAGVLSACGAWRLQAWMRALAWSGTADPEEASVGVAASCAIDRDLALRCAGEHAERWGVVTDEISICFMCYF